MERAVVTSDGGTGSFGKKFVEIMVRGCQPRRLVIFSRDEVKQREMKASGFDHPSIQYFVGDVRDASSLERALAGVTIVIHAAAIKDIRICENSPFEAIQTNIIGCRNIVNASVGQQATRILLSAPTRRSTRLVFTAPQSAVVRRCLCRRMRLGAKANPGFVAFVMELFWAPAEA